MADERDTATTPDRQMDPDPLGAEVKSAVLEDEDGEPYVVDQQNIGPAPDTDGSGEWPDPDAAPQAPAPGAA